MTKTSSGGNTTVATQDKIKSILGEIDPERLLEIISLAPTIAEVEAASMWLSGDSDIFGPGQPVKGKASRIVTILTAEEEEEPPPVA
jgi:hypothetical protein